MLNLAVFLNLFCKNILHSAIKVCNAHKLAMGLESVTTDRESGSRHKGVVNLNGNDLGSQFLY